MSAQQQHVYQLRKLRLSDFLNASESPPLLWQRQRLWTLAIWAKESGQTLWAYGPLVVACNDAPNNRDCTHWKATAWLFVIAQLANRLIQLIIDLLIITSLPGWLLTACEHIPDISLKQADGCEIRLLFLLRCRRTGGAERLGKLCQGPLIDAAAPHWLITAPVIRSSMLGPQELSCTDWKM